MPEDKQAALIPAGWFEQWADATWATDPEGAKMSPPVLRAHHLPAVDVDAAHHQQAEIADQRLGEFVLAHPRVLDVDHELATAETAAIREGDLEVEFGPVLASRVIHRVPFLGPAPAWSGGPLEGDDRNGTTRREFPDDMAIGVPGRRCLNHDPIVPRRAAGRWQARECSGRAGCRRRHESG